MLAARVSEVRRSFLWKKPCFWKEKPKTRSTRTSKTREWAEAGEFLPRVAKLVGKTRNCCSTRTSKTTSYWKDLKLNIHLSLRSLKFRCWQRAIFPGGGPPSIFASVGLYDRVRDGNGWFTYDWPPTNLSFADVDYLRLQLYAEDCTRYNFNHHF